LSWAPSSLAAARSCACESLVAQRWARGGEPSCHAPQGHAQSSFSVFQLATAAGRFPFFCHFFFFPVLVTFIFYSSPTCGGHKSSKTRLATELWNCRNSRFGRLAAAGSRKNAKNGKTNKNGKNLPGLVLTLWRAAAKAPSPPRDHRP